MADVRSLRAVRFKIINNEEGQLPLSNAPLLLARERIFPIVAASSFAVADFPPPNGRKLDRSLKHVLMSERVNVQSPTELTFKRYVATAGALLFI